MEKRRRVGNLKYLLDLPTEVLQEIFLFLELYYCETAIQRVCVEFRNIINSKLFYTLLLKYQTKKLKERYEHMRFEDLILYAGFYC